MGGVPLTIIYEQAPACVAWLLNIFLPVKILGSLLLLLLLLLLFTRRHQPVLLIRVDKEEGFILLYCDVYTLLQIKLYNLWL